MQTISYQQLRDVMAKSSDVKVINVLSAEQFRKANIPGSFNIPGDSADFLKQVESLIGSKDKPVVVYCGGYSCPASKNAAEKLENAGFTQVKCYEGGMEEWQEKSGKSKAA